MSGFLKIISKIRNNKFGWATIVTIFGVVGLAAAALLAVAILMPAQPLNLREEDFNSLLTIMFPLSMIAVTVFSSWLLTKKDPNLSLKRILGLRLPNKKVWWIFPAVLFGYIAILIIVTMILYAISPNAAQQEQEVGQLIQTIGGWQLILTILGVAVITPIAEELFFRGMILWTYSEKLNLVFSIGLTSIIFALAHMQLNVGIDTFIFGIGLGILRWQTESVYPSITLHMLKNSIAAVVLVLN